MTFMVHTSSLTPPKQPAKPVCPSVCVCIDKPSCVSACRKTHMACIYDRIFLLFGSFCLQLSYCKAFEPFDIMQHEVKLCVIEFNPSDFYCLVSVVTAALASLQEF